MNSPANYSSLEAGNPFRDRDESEDNEEGGVIIHQVPETKARWNHIANLDSFFTRMYNYHQKHGFLVILCDEVLQLLGLAFVVWLLTFAFHCLDYPILFGDKPASKEPNTTSVTNKVTIGDVIKPYGKCVSEFAFTTYVILVAAFLFFLWRTIRVVYQMANYADIKKFYNTALKIDDDNLDNITWHEVQKNIREVQAEQHMVIDKEQLTELDIYHRILRFKNYMVALMNKNLLPVRFHLPLFGEVVSLSRGLTYNIEFILFRGPWAPFENNWQLRDDYNIRSNQVELAGRLSKQIMWVAIVNFLMIPFIFCYQIIHFSFGYVAILRKEPGSLGIRTWSNYGRLYLRHFNELDHELEARLNRAYEPANRYMNSFSSPLLAVIAKNILFMTGGVLILILALGIYDEYVFQVEHILTLLAALTGIGVVCKILIPDENQVYCPEQLLTAVLAHVHYLPSDWRNHAHTTQVRKEFDHYFQFKINYLLAEILSPVLTPYILMFVFRPKSLEIVKFFRSFTVSVKGVGNVCSFAQMDVRKHGNPDWQLSPIVIDDATNFTSSDPQPPLDNGKTELSLVHFTLTNPEWKLPTDAKNFMKTIRQNAVVDLSKAKTLENIKENDVNPMAQSLVSFGSMGDEYSSIANSVFNQHNLASLSKSGLGKSLFSSGGAGSGPVPGASTSSYTKQKNSSSMELEDLLQQDLGDINPTYKLQDIHEADEEDSSSAARVFSPKMSSSTGTIMDRSRRRGMQKYEGRPEGPGESLLYSIYGINPSMAANPADITTADMCLSTLYLHELHHRQVCWFLNLFSER
ncbi:ATG9A family protein [Megaselia abdita]